MPTLSGNSVSNGVSAETAILNNLQATTSRPKKIPFHYIAEIFTTLDNNSFQSFGEHTFLTVIPASAESK